MDSTGPLPYQHYDDSSLEGDMTIPDPIHKIVDGQEYHTLDEPVKETILRDVRAVGLKFFHVLYPKQKKALLKDWDLWGPLILCVFLAAMLQGSEDAEDLNSNGLQFAEIFVIVWMGAIMVTLNSKLLGGNISCFQSVCVLGYCLLAPSIALLLCLFVELIFKNSFAIFVIKFVFTMLGFAWATLAATVFLGDSQPPRRKALAVYPICLFYFVISWLIISHSS